jgi:hypothetical protein
MGIICREESTPLRGVLSERDATYQLTRRITTKLFAAVYLTIKNRHRDELST